MRDITLLRIFKLIEESKFNFKEFAQACSIAPNSITDWKTGRSKPSVDALRKISKTYKVQLEWLTGDSKYRTKEEEFYELNKKKGEK